MPTSVTRWVDNFLTKFAELNKKIAKVGLHICQSASNHTVQSAYLMYL